MTATTDFVVVVPASQEVADFDLRSAAAKHRDKRGQSKVSQKIALLARLTLVALLKINNLPHINHDEWFDSHSLPPGFSPVELKD